MDWSMMDSNDRYLSSPEDPDNQNKPKRSRSYRKKVDRLWSNSEIFRLIREVEKRSILWNIGSDEYKMPKDHDWQEVANSIPALVNECKGKWTNLRISFNHYLKKYKHERSGCVDNHGGKVTWRFFKPLLFLDTGKVSQSSSEPNIVHYVSDETEDKPFVSNLNYEADDSPSHLVSDQPLSSPAPIRPRRSTRNMETTADPLSFQSANSLSNNITNNNNSKARLKDMAVEALQSIRAASSQRKDPSVMLGEYISSELLALTPQQAAIARSMLRRSFNDILDEVVIIAPSHPIPNDIVPISMHSSSSATICENSVKKEMDFATYIDQHS